MPDPSDLCLDHLSLRQCTALELAHIAAESGFSAVSIFSGPLPLGPYADLVEDRKARRDLASALDDLGLGRGVIEPFMLTPDPDWSALRSLIDVAAELGFDVNALGFDDVGQRQLDNLARLAEFARDAGVVTSIEGFSMSTIRTCEQAIAAAEYCGADVVITVDCLHVIRTGGSWEDVAALPPDRVRHLQLCDGNATVPTDLGEEAISGRLLPGEGDFNLKALLPHIPATARVAVEAPFAAPDDMTATHQGRVLMNAALHLFDQ